jgi:hypothetical protein
MRISASPHPGSALRKSLAIPRETPVIVLMAKPKTNKGGFMPKAKITKIAHVARLPSTANAAGTAFSIKCFPHSRPAAREGPYQVPRRKPATSRGPRNSTFDDWVEYYVQKIGSAVEKLNALQFDLEEDPRKKAHEMGTTLDELAKDLNLHEEDAHGPEVLHWPLAGSYRLSWRGEVAGKLGFRDFNLDLFFENDPDYRVVTNVSIEVTANNKGIAAQNSSTNSYIGTSSSGSH